MSSAPLRFDGGCEWLGIICTSTMARDMHRDRNQYAEHLMRRCRGCGARSDGDGMAEAAFADAREMEARDKQSRRSPN